MCIVKVKLRRKYYYSLKTVNYNQTGRLRPKVATLFEIMHELCMKPLKIKIEKTNHKTFI